jgi:ABC-type nitrate/sulfonate/bicarbonate transport system permease component
MTDLALIAPTSRRWPTAVSSGVRRALPTAGVALALLVAWQVVAAEFFEGKATLPKPTEVVRALWDDKGIYPRHIEATLGPALRGWIIGSAAAIVIAAIALVVPRAERALLRVGVATYSLPIVAVGPILLVSLDGNAPGIALATLSVFFTSLVAAVNGFHSVSRSSADITRALGGNGFKMFVKVRLRSALPSLFAGLKIGFPAAVIGAMVGEFLGATRGLGVYMVQQVAQAETARVWATAVIVTMVTTAGFVVIGLAGTAATRWVPFAPRLARVSDAGYLRRTADSVITLAITAGVLLAIWVGYLHLFHIDHFVGKTPTDVWHFFTSSGTATARSEVFHALRATLVDAGVGLLVGWVAGLVVAVAFVQWAPLERTLMPAALALRAVPIIAILPMLTLVFGRGLLGTVLIVALIVFFPTLILVMGAMRSVPDDLLAISRAFDAGPFALLTKVRLPTAVPAVFASLRIACPGAILGALLAEWLATGKGLGYLMLSATTRSTYTTLWAATVVVTVLAIVAYTVTDAVERWALTRFSDRPS